MGSKTQSHDEYYFSLRLRRVERQIHAHFLADDDPTVIRPISSLEELKVAKKTIRKQLYTLQQAELAHQRAKANPEPNMIWIPIYNAT